MDILILNINKGAIVLREIDALALIRVSKWVTHKDRLSNALSNIFWKYKVEVWD